MKNKNILITGSTSGIGKATLELCAKNGANIIAHARKENENFTRYLQEIASLNAIQITPIYFDLSDHLQIENELKKILKNKIKIDGLVNNAGYMQEGSFFLTPMQKIIDIFLVNFFAQVLITQLVCRQMIKQKGGSIVNIASINALDSNPGVLGYSSSKAALVQFGQSLAAELSGFNIRVNNIAPGYTQTKMTNDFQKSIGLFIERNNLIKRFAKPCEVAQAVVFLLSDKSSYINAQTIRVDGGIKHWI